MSNIISTQLNEMIARFKDIESFINTRYDAGERATLKELARKIKVPLESITMHLNTWLDYVPRNDAKSNMIHRLGIFFSAKHERPPELGQLKLSVQEKHRMFMCSKNMHLPTYAYAKLFKYLSTQTPELRSNVERQLKETLDKTFTNLNGLYCNSKLSINGISFNSLTEPEWCNRGNCVTRVDDYDVWLKWGRKTLEQHEAHKVFDPTTRELICLARGDETVVNRKARKVACSQLNQLVETFYNDGLILTDVHGNFKVGSENYSYPLLIFTHPGDAMVTVEIAFKCYSGLGKFILN